MNRPLPPGFLLGCATSAYQVEGGIENDWSAWERLGRLKDPLSRCGLAADHWARFDEDLELLVRLGANAYRLSIEWARVEPEPGVFDDDALSRYARMLDRLRARRIEPVVTLLHFTHPRWFHEICPWHERGAAERFGRFVERTLAALGDRVRLFTVLNEPNVWLTAAYAAGVFPPGERSLRRLSKAAAELVRAHVEARRALSRIPAARVGVAHNAMRFEAARAWHPGERAAAAYLAHHYNHAFLGALTNGVLRLGLLPGLRVVRELPEARGALDFIGVNYYSRVFVSLPMRSPFKAGCFYEDRDGAGVSDLGWEVHPRGLTEALLELRRYGLPLYVTENGIDDRDDTRRSAFLHGHLCAVLDAIDRGADVRGYFHWSLLDNFEWLEAFGPRFGLFRVDYSTMERRPTAAAALFGRIARARAVPNEPPPARRKAGTGRTPVF